MSITLDQIILDAQRIANRVKDLEALGNALLVEAEGNNRQIETMKQFQDDIDSLNKLARDKTNAEMVNRVNQQNPSLREFRQENRELKATLEDHQRALEIIMHKYREQMQHKIFTSRVNFKEIYNAKLQDMIYKQQEKINEMAAVMQKAASIDDDIVNNEIELITRLKVENQGLREMLQISKQFGTTSCLGYEDKAIQTEIDYILKMENGDELEATTNNTESMEEGVTTTTTNTNDILKVSMTSVSTTTTTAADTVSTANLSMPTSTTTTEVTAVATSTTTDQPDMKIVRTEIEPKNSLSTPSLELSSSSLSSSSSPIPLMNGESGDCKAQEQVS